MAFLKFRGNTTTPTKPGATTAANAPLSNTDIDGNFASLNDSKIEIGANSSTIGFVAGDILYASSANTLAKLAKGSDGQVLKLASGLPSWASDIDTNTNTTYTLDGSQTLTNSVNIELIAGGSGSGTDQINVIGAGGNFVSWNEASQRLTIEGGYSQTAQAIFSTSTKAAFTSNTDGGGGGAAIIFGSGPSLTFAEYIALSAVAVGDKITVSGVTGLGAANNQTYEVTAVGLIPSTTVSFIVTPDVVTRAAGSSGTTPTITHFKKVISGNSWNGVAIDAIRGGTGQTGYATGDILYASNTTTLAKLAKGTDGQVLRLASGVPSWGTSFIGTTSIQSTSAGQALTGINSITGTNDTAFTIAPGNITAVGAFNTIIRGAHRTVVSAASDAAGTVALSGGDIQAGDGAFVYGGNALIFGGYVGNVTGEQHFGGDVTILSGGTSRLTGIVRSGNVYIDVGDASPGYTGDVSNRFIGQINIGTGSNSTRYIDNAVGFGPGRGDIAASPTINIGSYNGTTNISATTINFPNVGTSGFTIGGTVNAVDFNSTSDIRFKKDLEKISNALSKVKQLTGYTYTLIETDTRSTGLIAQEVEEIMPESVGGDDNKKTLSYGSMMGLIVEAIKELDDKLEDIRNTILNK
jgi:hypothetical protein